MEQPNKDVIFSFHSTFINRYLLNIYRIRISFLIVLFPLTILLFLIGLKTIVFVILYLLVIHYSCYKRALYFINYLEFNKDNHILNIFINKKDKNWKQICSKISSFTFEKNMYSVDFKYVSVLTIYYKNDLSKKTLRGVFLVKQDAKFGWTEEIFDQILALQKQYR